jgi:hypothetical protein
MALEEGEVKTGEDPGEESKVRVEAQWWRWVSVLSLTEMLVLMGMFKTSDVVEVCFVPGKLG